MTTNNTTDSRQDDALRQGNELNGKPLEVILGQLGSPASRQDVEKFRCLIEDVRRDSRASVPAVGGDALKKLSSRIGDVISESLRSYRCQHTKELPDLENGLPLVDLLTPEPDKDVTRGVEECDLLADYVWSDVDDAIKEFAAAASSPLPAEPPTTNDALRCPHCGRRMVSEFDEDVGFWRECANCDYREAVSSTPAEPPPIDAKFIPPAEDALHVAICQAVQEHHRPTANAILRTALNDYKPTQLTRTELIRVQQRSGSGEVTAAMVSPAEPRQEGEWNYDPDEETLLDQASNKQGVVCACRTFAIDLMTRAYLDGCDFVHTLIACPEMKLSAVTPPETPSDAAMSAAREWLRGERAAMYSTALGAVPPQTLPPQMQKQEDDAVERLAAIITRHLPATPPASFIEAFRNTAIKYHGALAELVRLKPRLHDGPLEHQGPWEECDWIECEDRRKMISELEAATPSPETPVGGEAKNEEIETCPVCKNEVPLDSMWSYNNVPNAFCQECVDSGRVGGND